MTSVAEHHEEDFQILSEEKSENLKIDPEIAGLFMAPPCLVLLACGLVFVMRKYNYTVRKFLFVALFVATIVGIAGKRGEGAERERRGSGEGVEGEGQNLIICFRNDLRTT